MRTDVIAGSNGKRIGAGLILAVVSMLGIPDPLMGEEKKEDPKWTNATDFSYVLTEGNSDTETIGFKNTLVHKTKKGRTRLKMLGDRINRADDRFLLVDPGFTWEPGEPPPPVTWTVVDPATEPDVEKYFMELRFDRKFTEKFTWNAGGSWDRNRDAGILNRTIAFGGIGNIWWDREKHHFNTSYGLSYTDREEDEPDPLKSDKFAGIRFTSDYLVKWRKTTTFKNDLTFNNSLENSDDYSFDMTNSLSVDMNNHLALKISIQHLYNSVPALEDLDLIAFVILIDPDGIPGNGDEFFETVATGGIEFELGDEKARREKLDTIFRTSLTIKF